MSASPAKRNANHGTERRPANGRAPRPGRDPLDGYLENVDLLDTRRFLIAVRRLADTLSHGTDHSRFLGSGIEYVQSRPYLPGDPVRAIDWRVTARTARYHIKEFEAPKRLPAWLLVDTSASMAVTSVARSKYAIALHIAGGLALACLDRVSPVGVLGTGDRELRIEPSLSRQMVMQWLVQLRRFRYDEETSLAAKATELNASLKHRALVVVLSDLHDPQAVAALRLMGQIHDVVVLQLQDPAEQSLSGAGLVRAREAETGRGFTVRGRRAGLDQSLITRGLRRGGIDHLLIRTDAPFARPLRHFFAVRGLTAGGGGR
ncbi:MAG: DUF58 domain-containing protein [Planctomycetota bacterium]